MQVALTHESVLVHALAHEHADSSCACSLSGSKGTLGWVVWCYMHEHAPYMHVPKPAVDKNQQDT